MLWFKHSSDARNSLKLRKVRRKFGADGYAIYWFCLEAIAHDVDKDNLTFNLKEDAETIGFELTIQEKRVNEIMIYMVDVGLFESSNNTITCLKLAERLDKSMTNSPKMRAWLGDKGKEKVSESVMTLSDNVIESVDSVSTCAELDKNRLEENRINKDLLTSVSETKKVKQFVRPTFEQVIEYCNQRKNTVDANKFLDHYDSAGWMRGKTKIKCWKACVRTWENNSSNQVPAKFAKPVIDNNDTSWMENKTFEDKYCDKS